MGKFVKACKRIKKQVSKLPLQRMAVSLLIALLIGAVARSHKSDKFIFNQVLLFSNDVGSCSAQQVNAPSGKQYVLTAAHCKPLLEGGKLKTEDGKEYPAKLVAEDPQSDLLLLEPVPGLRGLDIAISTHDRDEVRTFTHGEGMKAYKTSGVLIEIQHIDIMIGPIVSDLDMAQCTSMPKYKVGYVFGIMPVCVLSVEEAASTAFTAPGSSGGAVVDKSGDIVGVVTGGGEGYSFFVRLQDIRQLLSDR